MVWFRRIFYFLITNIAFVFILSITAFVLSKTFGINIYDNNVSSIMIYSLIIGFTGSFISLLLSKKMAMFTTKTQLITVPSTHHEHLIYSTIAQLSEKAGIKMPDVGIYENDSPNAFATGYSKNNSLISVSTGLLYCMDDDEIKGVLAHEMAHIINGDMITLTLIQGVVNTFVIALSRVLTNLITAWDERIGAIMGMAIYLLLQVGLGFLGSLIVSYFSRLREYRADEGSVFLMNDKKYMIKALQKLENFQNNENMKEDDLILNSKGLNAFGINGFQNIITLFSTHPKLSDRIKNLNK